MKYRPEIDGLRAVAVVPVIFFHAGFAVFSGGYVGVDVFFVLSGYLITTLILQDLERDEFSIIQFYERRARRILPALFFVILACIPFAWIWMPSALLIDFFESVVAVVFFVSNILFWKEEGYFASAAELKPLLHTWSLSVEEQFYLLFPPFLLLVWKYARHRIAAVLLIASIASLGLSEWAVRTNPSANFYLAPTRAWELLVGSLCAIRLQRVTQEGRDGLAALGLLLIVMAIFLLDPETPFPGVYALAPVLGTALIILYGTGSSLTGKLLSLRPFVGIGLISYSAYLWHQPMFAFARLRSPQEPHHWLMAGLAVLSLILAALTWRFVETPFRHRRGKSHFTRKQIFFVSGVAASVLAVFSIVGVAQEGYPDRQRRGISFAEIWPRIHGTVGLDSKCQYGFEDGDVCRTDDNPTVLVWGDSFAMHLVDGIVASDPAIRLQQHTIHDCSPVVGVAYVSNRKTAGDARECMRFNDRVVQWIYSQDQPMKIIVSSIFTPLATESLLLSDGSTSPPGDLDLVVSRLSETIEALRANGHEVVLVSPTPSSGWDVGQCLLKSVYFQMDEAACDFRPVSDGPRNSLVEKIAEYFPVYSLARDICSDGVCDAMQDGVFVYRDGGHLTARGSVLLGVRGNWARDMLSLAE